ncbi:MAG: patatin-like phospholipase family protein [Candidatus Yanofskybacteria bacterium]|nr:patatin-like phospholipase family protein [Candidatus Yanofskybacteria bacterium]
MLKPKVGIVAPGHFKRLAAEFAFLHAYYEACQKGFPLPDYMTGVSAGGIAVACAAQWTEADFVRTEEILLNLKRKHFYGINPKLEVLGGLAAVAALGTMLPIDKDTIRNPWLRYGTKTAIALSILGMDKRFVEGLLHSDSIFSNKNLYKLLKRELRMNRIFGSPIKIEIASADINNRRLSIVSNFRPEDQKPEILLNGIVDSTRLPVFFSFRKDGHGNYLADGAALSNVPIHLARDHGCDVIIVLKFHCAGEGPIVKEYDEWGSGLQRFIDILVDEKTSKTMRGYDFFNHDLEQEEKIKRAIELTGDCEARKILESVKLSASGRRKIKLIVVDSEEIPEFHFSSFDRETTRQSMNIGYRAFFSVQDQIARAIGL